MKRLIMVIGTQRSGTTILFRSLTEGGDQLTFYHESMSNDMFENYFLKPEHEVRKILYKKRDPILIKPNSETRRRSMQELLDEFHRYDVRIVGIYRDPVNVFYSYIQRGWSSANKGSISYFIQEWNLRNLSLLIGKAKNPDRIAIVRYSDLTEDSGVFNSLCYFVGVKGNYLFREDSMGGKKKFPPEIIRMIESGTKEIWEDLNGARSFKPGVYDFSAYKKEEEVFTQKKNKYFMPTNGKITGKKPDEIDGLILWLEADKIDTHQDAKPELTWPNSTIVGTNITGHGRLSVVQNSINGLPAIKIENDGKEISYFRIESRIDWRFTFNGSNITLFIVYMPIAREKERSSKFLTEVDPLLSTSKTLLEGPGFTYFWSNKDHSGNVIIIPDLKKPVNNINQSIIDSPNVKNSHANNTWGLDVFEHSLKNDRLNSFLYQGMEKIRGGKVRLNKPYPVPTDEENNFYIGALPGRSDLGFNGFVSEILIYSNQLRADQRMSITQYLQEKYDL